MKTASWIILGVVGLLMLLGSLPSLGFTYGSARDLISPTSLAEVSFAMPEFFKGLYPWEFVLLVVGVLLSLLTFVAFVVYLIQGKPLTTLLMFFAVAGIMIAFPSIKSIEFSKGLVKIETDTKALQANPRDKSLRDGLTNEVERIAPRLAADPNPSALIKVAQAQIALGNNTAAEANVQKALQASPQFAEAKEVTKRLDLDRKLTTLASRVEQDSNDTAAKSALQQTVTEAARLPVASPVTITNIARAQMVIGDRVQAESNINKALEIDPNLPAAQVLKNRNRTMVVQPTPGHP